VSDVPPDLGAAIRRFTEGMRDVGVAAAASAEKLGEALVAMGKGILDNPRLMGALSAYEDWKDTLWLDDNDEKDERHD